MTLTEYDNIIGLNSKVANGQDQDANFVKAINPPFGIIEGWHKTFGDLSTGTADTDITDKLVDSGATFITDGIKVGMIVRNTDDDNFAIVSAVDSETSLSLKADTKAGSSTTDIFPLGTEGYTVYGNYELPDAWIEANGQTISDTDSPFNGKTVPDLNTDIFSGQGGRFLRGGNVSGTLQADQNKTHTHTYEKSSGTSQGDSGSGFPLTTSSDVSGSSGGDEARPYNMTLTYIIRIK